MNIKDLPKGSYKLINGPTNIKDLPEGSYNFVDEQEKPAPKKPTSVFGVAGDVVKGAAKGVGSTVVGLGQLALKGYTLLPGEQRLAEQSIQTGEDIKEKYLTPKNTAQKVGFGAEQIAEFFIPAGAAAKGVKAVELAANASKLGKVGKAAAKIAGKAGIGAVEAGSVRAAQTGGDPTETLGAAAFGAAAPFAIGAAQKVVRGAKKATKFMKAGKVSPVEEAAILKTGAADARVAGKALDDAGNIIKDPVSQNAIKRGIADRDVAAIKVATQKDAQNMKKMLEIAKKGATDKIYSMTNRSSDVVGESLLSRARFISQKNKQAANQLNVIADRLKGNRVDITDPITTFLGELENAGIAISKKGKLKFKGSEFEGIRPAENAINNLWNRIRRFKSGDGDALEIHRLKRYIDNVVEYGKTTEGLVGKAQNVLKHFRRGIDTNLDTAFPAYNKANTIFAETVEQLNEVNRFLGRRVKLGDQFANVKAGGGIRALLQNAKSKTEVMEMLSNLEKVAKKYGLKTDDSILTQASFADTIENVFGSEGSASFMGQIEKSIGRAQDAAQTAADIGTGRIMSAGMRMGRPVMDFARKLDQANKIKALEELLEEVSKKSKSVFGKR